MHTQTHPLVHLPRTHCRIKSHRVYSCIVKEQKEIRGGITVARRYAAARAGRRRRPLDGTEAGAEGHAQTHTHTKEKANSGNAVLLVVVLLRVRGEQRRKQATWDGTRAATWQSGAVRKTAGDGAGEGVSAAVTQCANTTAKQRTNKTRLERARMKERRIGSCPSQGRGRSEAGRERRRERERERKREGHVASAAACVRGG